MISLHFCRAGRQQIGCVKWKYGIFTGKKKGKDCRKHQEEDSVSSARNMNKRIF